MSAMVPTMSAIRNAPHSVSTTTGRVAPVRRIGGARPTGTNVANTPVSERAARNMVPTMVNRSETVDFDLLDQVKAWAGSPVTVTRILHHLRRYVGILLRPCGF